MKTKFNWRTFGVLAMLFGFVFIGSAKAQTIEFLMQNDHPNAVLLEFYSQDRDVVWPGNGEVFNLNTSDVTSFPLACEAGEMICYGAWVDGDEATHWGVGKGGGEGCDNCCYTCEDGQTPVLGLNQ